MVRPWPRRRGGGGGNHAAKMKEEVGGGRGKGEGETKRDDAGDERRRRVSRDKKVEKMRVGCGKTGHVHE